LDTTQSYWSRIYDYNTVDSTQDDDIDVWRGQMLPDLSLHKHNRYGHLIRPRQSLYRDLVEARQNFVYKLNELLGEILLVDEMQDWEQVFYKEYVKGTVTYKTSKYWNFADWRLIEKDHNDVVTFEYDTNIVADVTYNDYPKMIADTSQSENTYALVKVVPHSDGINRPETYRYDGTQWKLVHKQKATIAFSEEVWNQSKFGHGYDAQGFDITPFDSGSSDILSTLFDDLRNKVFINTHRIKYNKLWFSSLYQAVLQNTTSDFAFKTTYVRLKVQHPVLTNRTHYERYNISVVEDYLQQIKPFHTKVHSVMDSNTLGEGISVEIDDKSHSKMLVEMRRLDHSLRNWQCDIILNGGDFGYTPGNEDVSAFTSVDADYDIIYNGNKFDQPACEWEGDELYPVDYTENISIAVQTNASGDSVTGDTRSFRINYYEPMGIEVSNVIVDTKKTVLASDVTATATDIPVANASVLDQPTITTGHGAPNRNGVVWIGTERIEYGAIDDNADTLKFCVRGTLGTGQKAHTSGDTVINSGNTTKIPALEKFSHYGDNLRMAYNDSGITLADPGITPEHAFIRNAGQGSI
jgi:hypothetical protein